MADLTLPPKTRAALGQEAAAEFAEWAGETFALRGETVRRDEFQEIISRLDILEHDMSGVKAEIVELRREMGEIHARFESMHQQFNARLDAVYQHFDARFDAVHGRFESIHDRFESMHHHFDSRFDRLQTEMNIRFDHVHERIDTIHDVIRSQTRWLVGILLGVGGLISVLLTAFELMR